MPSQSPQSADNRKATERDFCQRPGKLFVVLDPKVNFQQKFCRAGCQLTERRFQLVIHVDTDGLIGGLKLFQVPAEVVLHDLDQLLRLAVRLPEQLGQAVKLAGSRIPISTAAADDASSPKMTFMYSARWAVPSLFYRSSFAFPSGW